MDPDAGTAALAEVQHGVIARGQAVRHGLTRHGIAHRLLSGRWELVYPGVYRLMGSVRTWQQHLIAACLAAGTGAVASHRAAGRLWSLPVDHAVEVTVPWTRRVRVHGFIVHRARSLDRRDIRRVEGIPVTSVARTVVDLAAVLSETDLATVVDHACARRLIRPAQIGRLLQVTGRGHKGSGSLSQLLQARPSSGRLPQSLFELRLKQALIAHGLPAPAPQYPVRLANGRRAYLDFAYPDAMLAIEADSYRHHSSLTDWSRDRTRNNELIAQGWRMLPVTPDDLANEPTRVANQVARALAAASEAGTIRPP